MKKFIYIFIFMFLFIGFNIRCFAEETNIILNNPITDDVNHTFKYPNLEISNDFNPFSITLSVENGYFNTNNETLNIAISNYFNFKGGTNTSNVFVSTLNTTTKYKVITFNLKSSVDLSNSETKQNVISSIQSFLRDILFYNNEGKDAKFTLSFSEVKLSFSNAENNLEGIEVIAFKDPNQPKEHYYAKIMSGAIDWKDAYNIAASLKFNNLQGYLLTITSEEEHNFIYQSLGSIKGWMGSASIENSEDITYNTKNIIWNPANDVVDDTNKKDYWYWVSGPEAGDLVFKDGSYTNFTSGEPNNFYGREWCGEYGHGTNGMWNDYPNDIDEIQGYYVEFGGFDDDSEEVKPVSLVNTFKWNDYDFRNIDNNIDEKLENIKYDENTTEEEIQKAIDEAIIDSGVENVTTRIINKSIKKNKLTYDIEVTIGNDSNKKVYTKHVEETIKIQNPQTGDKIVFNMIGLLLFIMGIFSFYPLIKKCKNRI